MVWNKSLRFITVSLNLHKVKYIYNETTNKEANWGGFTGIQVAG